MKLDDVIALARKNIGGAMESSARLCIDDAERLQAQGNLDYAKVRAVKSLGYSVGIFHNDYQQAVKED